MTNFPQFKKLSIYDDYEPSKVSNSTGTIPNNHYHKQIGNTMSEMTTSEVIEMPEYYNMRNNIGVTVKNIDEQTTNEVYRIAKFRHGSDTWSNDDGTVSVRFEWWTDCIKFKRLYKELLAEVKG